MWNNQSSQTGKSFVIFLKNETYTYYMIQTFHSYIFTQEKRSHMSAKKIYTRMFTGALFETFKSRKQPECPATGE